MFLHILIPWPLISFASTQQATVGGVRRFIKPPESLERSLELSRHRGRKRTQKRPNYKNLGEEEDDERAGGGSSSGGGLEEGWDDDSVRGGEREKGKGIEGIGGGGGSSKGSRASGETAEGECVSLWTQQCRTVFVSVTSLPSIRCGLPCPPKRKERELIKERTATFLIGNVVSFVAFHLGVQVNVYMWSPCFCSYI